MFVRTFGKNAFEDLQESWAQAKGVLVAGFLLSSAKAAHTKHLVLDSQEGEWYGIVSDLCQRAVHEYIP